MSISVLNFFILLKELSWFSCLLLPYLRVAITLPTSVILPGAALFAAHYPKDTLKTGMGNLLFGA
jgi:hypothetical protein